MEDFSIFYEKLAAEYNNAIFNWNKFKRKIK